MADIEKIQHLLAQYHLDGWIFTDFWGSDRITREFLNLGERISTRRLFYIIPADSEPVKVLSVIEPLLLDHLPGRKLVYQGREGMDDALRQILQSGMRLACQYSPGGNVPSASTIDAGTMEYLKSFGVDLVSSADLLQYFGAVLTKEQIQTHREAGVRIHRVLTGAFEWIRGRLDSHVYTDEWLLLNELKRRSEAEGLMMDEPPFLGVDAHMADPAYEPAPEGSSEIKEGSRLIIDIAGRLKQSDAVYYDVTWCMSVGRAPDEMYKRLFRIVWEAREAVRRRLELALASGQYIKGCEADREARKVLEAYGLSKYIRHRTGHNIGTRCHGTGTNLDDYETHDDRMLLAGTLFSVEPGIYTKDYGVRLEYDIYITPEKKIEISGPVQNEILVI